MSKSALLIRPVHVVLLAGIFGITIWGQPLASQTSQSDNTGNVQWLDRSAFIPLAVVVAKVQARQKSGRLNIGTGVTVAPGVILTNCHVAGDAEEISVSKRAGVWRAVAQHAVGRHDLCYLKVPKWRGNSIVLADSGPPAMHQPVGALGYTGGVDMSFAEGRVSALHAHEGSYLVQTSTGFSSGASGGALLDSKARLLGILTFRLPGRSGHYFSVPADWVRAGMPTEDQWQPIGSPVEEKPFWQGDIETLPFFMQVAPLEAQEKWDDILELTERWAAAAPKSVEPLLARGKAFGNSARHAQAIDVLQRASRLDPRHQEVWFELGRNQLSANDRNGVQESLSQLLELNSELHKRLQTMNAEADK